MTILTIRTDKPESEIGLYENEKQLKYESWQAHRQLAETIHEQIAKNLQFVSKDLNDVEGIVIYKGPGSFTGLRIGVSVANALAYSLKIPIVATTGEEWLKKGIARLLDGESDKNPLPDYGGGVYITAPRK